MAYSLLIVATIMGSVIYWCGLEAVPLQEAAAPALYDGTSIPPTLGSIASTLLAIFYPWSLTGFITLAPAIILHALIGGIIYCAGATSRALSLLFASLLLLEVYVEAFLPPPLNAAGSLIGITNNGILQTILYRAAADCEGVSKKEAALVSATLVLLTSLVGESIGFLSHGKALYESKGVAMPWLEAFALATMTIIVVAVLAVCEGRRGAPLV